MEKLLSRKLGITLAAAAGLVTGAADFRTAVLVTVVVVAYVLGQAYVDGQAAS